MMTRRQGTLFSDQTSIGHITKNSGHTAEIWNLTVDVVAFVYISYLNVIINPRRIFETLSTL
jgi:hypothetical protein